MILVVVGLLLLNGIANGGNRSEVQQGIKDGLATATERPATAPATSTVVVLTTVAPTATPTATTAPAALTVAPTPTPTAAATLSTEAALTDVATKFFTAYNAGASVALSQYLSPASDAKCRDAATHVSAYGKLLAVEKLFYSLDELKVTSSSSTAAATDLTYSTKDAGGKTVDNKFTIGQSFTKEPFGWAFADDPLAGVGAFCK